LLCYLCEGFESWEDFRAEPLALSGFPFLANERLGIVCLNCNLFTELIPSRTENVGWVGLL
jgi:hypothetical protein